LRRETEVKRQICANAQNAANSPETYQFPKTLPRPTRRSRAVKHKCGSHQQQVKGKVPGIHEPDPAQGRDTERDAHSGSGQGHPAKADLPLPTAQIGIQRLGYRQQRQGHGKHMRMNIRQQEGKCRELIDHFHGSSVQSPILHDAACLPPRPSSALRFDGQRGRFTRQLWDIQILPDARKQQPPGMDHVQPAEPVPHRQHHQRRQQRQNRFPPRQKNGSLVAFRVFLAQTQEVPKHAVSPRGSHPKPKRRNEVIPNRGTDTRNADEHCRHQIAEVIVGNTVAREPGIHRRKARGFQNGVDKSHLHELFGIDDLRVCSPDQRHQDKSSQEEDFADQKQLFILRYPSAEVCLVSFMQDRQVDPSQDEERGDLRRQVVLHQTQSRQPPKNRSPEQHSQGAQQKDALRRQLFHPRVCQRQA